MIGALKVLTMCKTSQIPYCGSIDPRLTLHNLLPPASRRARMQSAEPITDTSPVLITDTTSPSLAASSPLSSLPDDTPPVERDLPPHQSTQHHAVAHRRMSKPVDFPKLMEELTPAAIDGWLGRCEDTYKAWLAMNPEKSLAPKVRITLAGLRMEQKAAATWWNENRAALKELTTWAAFAEKVKARFTPTNWKLKALTAFYAVCQNSSDFPAFVTQLENVRNALTSAGKGYSIPDSDFKNHLLFHCHPLLRLRVSGQPGFVYENLQVDGLIGNMTTSWLSLVAECVIRVPTAAPAPTSLPSVLSPSLPVATSASAAPAPFIHLLTQAEKDTLAYPSPPLYLARRPLESHTVVPLTLGVLTDIDVSVGSGLQYSILNDSQ
ncbi:hypothetical protein DFH08DRAFT_804738 [Mycena albidolilacea]|uniref:Retrotransposon gag domain-containing protein n=1 Tax=Mycena albidolilacea TaxID=1033008 RepID=A0AAD7AAX2_9AGAR|nr:hypothetical protein DFH08DRAFT_804738 [Mycena albidolilacea]